MIFTVKLEPNTDTIAVSPFKENAANLRCQTQANWIQIEQIRSHPILNRPTERNPKGIIYLLPPPVLLHGRVLYLQLGNNYRWLCVVNKAGALIYFSLKIK